MAERNLEDEYFARLDAEAKSKLRAKTAAETAVAEREKLRELHHFRCGKCGGQMHTTTFRGVDIEVCEDCSSVLLDPGELEALAGADSTDVFSGFFSMFGGKRQE